MGAGYQRAHYAGSSIARVTYEAMTPYEDDVTQSQLDRIEGMLADQARLLAELQPLLPLIPRALALLDPGAAMRRHLKPKRRPDAVPERTPAPVHVGPASEGRRPVDPQVWE
jgi:hypothetical protein